MKMIQKSAIILLLVMAASLPACGKGGRASTGKTATESAASEETSTEAASGSIYSNSALGIRITPGDHFEPYDSADAFAKAVRGKKWKTAFGENNRFEFGYKVSSDDRAGWFYGYSTKLSEEEQKHDLSDFVSAVELSIKDGDVSENGAEDIGDLTWQELDVSLDDGTQEILWLTKYRNRIMAIVIVQMQDTPIEDMCMEAVENM